MSPAGTRTLAPAWPDGSRTASARATLREFATGVTVLTCGEDERTHGVCVSTLTLASMKPPMVSVALRRGSRGLTTLLRAKAFVVNALSDRQEPLARHFARPDRGEGLDRPGPDVWDGRTADGVPLLGGAVGWLECRVERTVAAGDHELVLARVTAARLGNPAAPLLNFAGALHRVPFPTAPLVPGAPGAPTDDDTRSSR
jgi:flavin reductase (DIM6/NTAB) family NADH-FMN oxidoreductase RutF